MTMIRSCGPLPSTESAPNYRPRCHHKPIQQQCRTTLNNYRIRLKQTTKTRANQIQLTLTDTTLSSTRYTAETKEINRIRVKINVSNEGAPRSLALEPANRTGCPDLGSEWHHEGVRKRSGFGGRVRHVLEGKRAWRPRSTARGTTTEKKASATAAPAAATHRHRFFPAGAAGAAAGPGPFIPLRSAPEQRCRMWQAGGGRFLEVGLEELGGPRPRWLLEGSRGGVLDEAAAAARPSVHLLLRVPLSLASVPVRRIGPAAGYWKKKFALFILCFFFHFFPLWCPVMRSW